MTGYLRVLAVDDEPPALDELAYLLRADPRVGRVHLAGDVTVEGTAEALDGDGRLVVRTLSGLQTFGAGDVVHLR